MAKLIIDMDDNRYKRIISESESYLDYQILLAKLNNAIVLPDNCTNGDVIKTMFPECDADFHFDCFGTADWYSTNLDGRTDFSDEWWNAPYEG